MCVCVWQLVCDLLIRCGGRGKAGRGCWGGHAVSDVCSLDTPCDRPWPPGPLKEAKRGAGLDRGGFWGRNEQIEIRSRVPTCA